MENEKVYTKTRDRILIDQIYESPVDKSEHIIRNRLMMITAVGLFIVLLFCLMK